MPKSVTTTYGPGTRVEKTTGDYGFSGEVLLAFEKRSGQVRWLVEDDRGLVLIWNEQQITAAAVEPFRPQTRSEQHLDERGSEPRSRPSRCELCMLATTMVFNCTFKGDRRCAKTL